MKKYVFNGKNDNDRLAEFCRIIDNEYKAGTFVVVEFVSNKKTLAAHKNKIVMKKTRMVVRLGVEYQNTKFFIAKNIELHSLPSPNDKRVNGYERFLIETNKDGKVVYKVRLFTTEGMKAVTEWYVDGKLTTREDLVSEGIISESVAGLTKAVKNVSNTFTPFLNNLVSIGGKLYD